MSDMTVATTILQQLGGRRFIVMTGAKHIGGTADALSFKLPKRQGNPVNYVRITLTPADTYDVEFSRVHGLQYTIIHKTEGIYNDQLQELFTRYTGLQTSLRTMRSEKG